MHVAIGCYVQASRSRNKKKKTIIIIIMRENDDTEKISRERENKHEKMEAER